MKISAKNAVFFVAGLITIILFVAAELIGNGWILSLGLIFVPALGWYAQRKGWL